MDMVRRLVKPGLVILVVGWVALLSVLHQCHKIDVIIIEVHAKDVPSRSYYPGSEVRKWFQSHVSDGWYDDSPYPDLDYGVVLEPTDTEHAINTKEPDASTIEGSRKRYIVKYSRCDIECVG